MARTVDFLPFATNVGANVEGQSSYVIEPIRLTGHQAGVAKSAVINKSLRQHSMMTAALANLLSEALDVDVLDDGDVIALKNMLQDVLMGGRQTIMTTDLTLYVRTTGSDVNDGLTPTTAFATPQAAVNNAYDNLQLNGHALTIDIGPGTFGSMSLGAALVGQRGDYALWFVGAGKGSTTISSPAQACIGMSNGAAGSMTGMRLTGPTGSGWGDGMGIACHNCTARAYDIDFGPMSTTGQAFGNQVHSAMGASITLGYIDQDYYFTVSGGGARCLAASGGALLQLWNCKFTLTGTPNYLDSFAISAANSTIQSNNVPPGTGTVFSGAATGRRYAVDGTSTITTALRNLDPNFYPGSVGGSVVNSNLQYNYT